MKRLFLIISLLAPSLLQTALSLSMPPLPTYAHHFNNSDEVSVFEVSNIQFNSYFNIISFYKLATARSSNKNLTSKITNLKNKIESLEKSIELDEEINRLEKEIKNNKGEPGLSSTIEKSLRNIHSKIQISYQNNDYRETVEIKELKIRRDKLRLKYTVHMDTLAKNKSFLKLIKFKKKSQNKAIKSYQDEIRYLQRQLIDLRPLAKDFTVEMKLVKTYKGKSDQTLSFTISKNKTGLYDVDLKDIKLKEKVAFFKRDKDTLTVKRFNPYSDWKDVMNQIKAGTYYENFGSIIPIIGHPSSTARIISNNLILSGIFGGSYSHYQFLPNSQCLKVKRTKFDSVNRYKNAKDVITAKVTNVQVGAADKNFSDDKLLRVEQEITQRLKNIQSKLSKAEETIQFNTEFQKIIKKLKPLEVATNKRSVNKIYKIDADIKTIFNTNNHQDYPNVKEYRKKRNKLFEKYISDVTNLIELKSHLNTLRINKRFRSNDINDLQLSSEYYNKTKKAAQNYYAGSIKVEMEILDTFKGTLLSGKKLFFISKPEQRIANHCRDEFTNRFLFRAKQNDVVTLHLDYDDKVSKWSQYGGNYNDNNSFIKKSFLDRMAKIKAGTYKDYVSDYKPNNKATKK